MKNIADYLMEHYYSKYKGVSVPDKFMLTKALDLHQDKVVVVHDGPAILGVAVFLTLTDESYKKIEDFNMFNVETLSKLLLEDGDNIHFIMLTTTGVKNIMAGLKAVRRERNPKTVSWWNPDNNRLHRYNLN